MTDYDLLDAWVAGDVEAGGQLLERHLTSLRRFFENKVGDAAEDLIQRTMLACAESKTRFERRSSFRTYLLGIARNVLYAYLRERTKEQSALDFGVTSLQDLGVSPTGQLAQQERQAQVQEAMRTLPLDLQVALELHYWEQLGGEELAEALGLPRASARTRLRRARILLQRKLERMGLTDVQGLG